MKFGTTAIFGLLPLCLATVACAAPSIDFVNQEGAARTYRSVRCIATHSGGQSITAQGQEQSGASVVTLQSLLAGPSGQYKVQCTAVHADSGDQYTAEFEAVKFAEGDLGTKAPEYDANRSGYGTKIPVARTLTACYDKNNRVLEQACVDAYYGTKPHYLKSLAGLADVQFKYDEYASNVGVFLEANPRHGNR
jgi:hypothetical protein